MKVLRVRNVNDALPLGLQLLEQHGEKRDSRNGGVMVSPEPVTTVYGSPRERVIFDPVRDANPFFHLFESLWMLAGRNDLAYVAQFAKNMRSYSDDGQTMWGAYGWRWRSFFQLDQLSWAIARLRRDTRDRRVVIGMWSPTEDTTVADAGGRDVPCNVTLHVQVNPSGKLDMTVFNRSNDIVWGAYGANAVHFSILQEYLACAVGVPVGRYWQVSDNYHAYEALYEKLMPMARAHDEFEGCPYSRGEVESFPLIQGRGNVTDTWDQDLVMFLDEPTAVGFRHAFFRKVAKPMLMAHRAYREGDFEQSHEILRQMPVKNDWRVAAVEWVERREKNRSSKEIADAQAE